VEFFWIFSWKKDFLPKKIGKKLEIKMGGKNV
jgi:hypothetical protein